MMKGGKKEKNVEDKKKRKAVNTGKTMKERV